MLYRCTCRLSRSCYPHQLLRKRAPPSLRRLIAVMVCLRSGDFSGTSLSSPICSLTHSLPSALSLVDSAGILMNNLSQLFVSSSPNPENISQARAWAAKGLDVVETATRKAGIDQPSTLSSAKEGSNAQAVEKEERQTQNTCASAQATLLHNLGVLSEVRVAALGFVQWCDGAMVRF